MASEEVRPEDGEPVLRVLFVDDDRINAFLFENLCAAVPGVQTRGAASGSEALEAAAQWQPQALVLDLHLPDTDGTQLLGQLRSLLGPVPAFLCSAEEPATLEPLARDAGFTGVWPKPVDEARLLADLAIMRGPRSP